MLSNPKGTQFTSSDWKPSLQEKLKDSITAAFLATFVIVMIPCGILRDSKVV